MKCTSIPRELPKHPYQYKERNVQIEGPFRNLWLITPEIYFEKVDSDATKTAHLKSNATMKQIGTDHQTTNYALFSKKEHCLIIMPFLGMHREQWKDILLH